ncbi:MAG TPA: hypothetical protein VF316_02395 [Polyangiaceae bacterium]
MTLTFPAGTLFLPHAGDASVPLPSPDAPTGFVWPAARGRETLRAARGGPIEVRGDLVGQHGTADGSGRSDTLVCRTGAWCIKTSSRRRYADADAGSAALVRSAREKTLLGELFVPETALVLQPDGAGAFWLWTVAPWLTTLRSRMTVATQANDEAALGLALMDFARAAVDAMVLASVRQVVLDLHPSNYAERAGRLHYVDDDVAFGATFPMLGHALLRRVEEYEVWPAATERYLQGLEAQMSARLDGPAIARLGLRVALEQCFVRTTTGVAAQERLLSHLRKVARGRR